MTKTRNTFLLIIFSILLIPLTIFWLCNYLHNNSSLLEKLYHDDLQQVVQAILSPKPAGHEHFDRDITGFYSPNSDVIQQPDIYEKGNKAMERLAEDKQDLHVTKQPVINEYHEVVVRLTKKNFSSFIAENEYVMVNFYAPWCSWTQELAPEYEAAAATLLKGDKKVAFAKVDCDKEFELAWKYELYVYPMVFLFANGFPKMYGKGTRDDIVRWVRDNTPGVVNAKDDAVVTLTGKNFSSFIAKNEYVMVHFYASLRCWYQQALEAAATLLKGDGVAFAKVSAFRYKEGEEELEFRYRVPRNEALLLFVGGIPKPYYGDRSRDALVRWIRKSIAGVPSITNEYDAKYILATDFIKVVGFYDTLEDRDCKELFVASKLLPNIRFYQTTCPEVAKIFLIDPEIKHPPVLAQLRKVDEDYRQLVGSFTGFEIANIVSRDQLFSEHPRNGTSRAELFDQSDLPKYNFSGDSFRLGSGSDAKAQTFPKGRQETGRNGGGDYAFKLF